MQQNQRASREERIQHVVQTAKLLFIRQGYSATSTSQISREAGISEMTLFRYFATKRELFEAVIKPLIQINWFPQTDSGGKTSPESFLCLFDKQLRFVKQERDLVRLVILESQIQPDLAGDYNPIARVSIQLRELLRRFGLDADTSQVIINLIMGVFLTAIFTPNYEDRVIDWTFRLVESQIIQLLRERSSS